MSEDAVPLLSVVMAAYNSEQYIEQAIDSILNQSFEDFELIVIDDGSTDATGLILNSYNDPRLVLIRNERNLGQTRSLNRGLNVARGEFIARHDADDISDALRFAAQVKMLLKNRSLGLLGTAYHVIDVQGAILDTITPPLSNQALQEQLLEGNCFCHGSVMMRHEALSVVGLYNESFPVTQDYELWLRISEHYEIANLERPLYQFRFSGQSVSSQKRDTQLVYRQWAFELALQRRETGREATLPQSPAQTYKPQPKMLFKNARHSAYLHYLANDTQKAAESLQLALEIGTVNNLPAEWSTWIVGRARDLAQKRGDFRLATRFIHWTFEIIAPATRRSLASQAAARFFADQAFQAYEAGQRTTVLAMTARAVYHDKQWLRDRGIWSICWKSVIHWN